MYCINLKETSLKTSMSTTSLRPIAFFPLDTSSEVWNLKTILAHENHGPKQRLTNSNQPLQMWQSPWNAGFFHNNGSNLSKSWGTISNPIAWKFATGTNDDKWHFVHGHFKQFNECQFSYQSTHASRVYPLVMTNISMENHHRNSGLSHGTRWFSIDMCARKSTTKIGASTLLWRSPGKVPRFTRSTRSPRSPPCQR